MFNNSLFWYTDIFTSEQTRFTCILSGSPRANSATAEGLAVDWVGKKIYWSDVFTGQIMSMTTNKTHKTPLSHVATPRAVAVHPCKGSVLR